MVRGPGHLRRAVNTVGDYMKLFTKSKDREDQIKLLSLARESLIRAGAMASQADDAIEQLTGDKRDLEEIDRDWAFSVMARVVDEHGIELET